MAALRLDQVSFRYPSGFVLQGISLEIPDQSFLALIGPNGSGKTTLLRVMTKLIRPDSGEVYLNGRPLSGFRPRELAQHMAVVSSDQFFEFPFPVAEVVAMGRYSKLGRLQRMSVEDRRIIVEALQMTQTEHLRERPVSQLSSGERQRVLVARALAQDPSILILDEPNAHLDINHQIAIFHLLQSLNRDRKMTIVVVLHDLTAAAAFCSTLVLLHQGRLVKQGLPEDVITAEVIRSTYGAEVFVHPSPIGGFPQITYAPCRK